MASSGCRWVAVPFEPSADLVEARGRAPRRGQNLFIALPTCLGAEHVADTEREQGAWSHGLALRRMAETAALAAVSAAAPATAMALVLTAGFLATPGTSFSESRCHLLLR